VADGARIAENIADVRRRIAAAAARGGRDPGGVRLVAVTKTVGPAEVAAVLAAGVSEIGENRVRDALSTAAAVRPPEGLRPRWHMVGHLQRNKVRAALELFEVVHSVDSARLLEALAAETARREQRLEVLLEVNVSGEESKYGLPAEAVAGVLERAAGHERLDVTGLMTMAPFVEDPEEVRGVFSRLRELRDELNRRAACPRPLVELSMGMTGDFEVAVEEGATIVRIGTALFR